MASVTSRYRAQDLRRDAAQSIFADFIILLGSQRTPGTNAGTVMDIKSFFFQSADIVKSFIAV